MSSVFAKKTIISGRGSQIICVSKLDYIYFEVKCAPHFIADFSMGESNRNSLELFGKILHQIKIRLVKAKETDSREEKRTDSPRKPHQYGSEENSTQPYVLLERIQGPTLKIENYQSDVVSPGNNWLFRQ